MVNNVVLIGRITRDIDMNMSNSGTEVCRFTLAVNRNRKNANGEYEADFINCVAFGQTARFMSQFIRKGYQVSVTGRIQTGRYENQQGQTVYTTDVIVESLNNLEPRRDNSNGGYNNDFGQSNNNYAQQNNNVNNVQANPYQAPANDNSFASSITDDDLPF